MSLQDIVRELVRRDSVKLWLPPFATQNWKEADSLPDIPKDLVEKYAKETRANAEQVLKCLTDLRLNALKKINDRKRYSDTGVACLQVSVIYSDALSENTQLKVEIQLDSMNGLDLKQMIAGQLSINFEDIIQLVASGRQMTNSNLLNNQGLIHGSSVLCFVISEKQKQANKWKEEIEKTRQATMKLLTPPNRIQHMLVSNQDGDALKLPPTETQALSIALALHEKGRSALKQQEYAKALLMFLESDREFRQCRSDILQSVDNYAILCLDIVWCYLCLHSVNCLPDAEDRLRNCEQCFQRSYGTNLERVSMLKGFIDQEKGLFIRLKLLKGILSFYKHDFNAALNYFLEVETDMKELEIDNDLLNKMILMGFDQPESRLALRATRNNLEAAINYIATRREAEVKKRAKEREATLQRRLQKRLGKTKDGNNIDVSTYQKLVSMGFESGRAIAALRDSNNNLNSSIEYLQRHRFESSPAPEYVSDALIRQVMSMGFTKEQAEAALRTSNGITANAVSTLLADRSGSSATNALMEVASNLAAAASAAGIGNQLNNALPVDGTQFDDDDLMSVEEEAALEEIRKDLHDNPEDHLDLTFEEESRFLDHYKALLLIRLKQ